MIKELIELYQSELEALAVKIEELKKSWKPIFLAEVANLYAKEFMGGRIQGLSDASSLVRESITKKNV